MGGKKKKLDEILELVHFMVDFVQTKVATKEELHEEISRLDNKIERLDIKLENKIEKLNEKLGKEISQVENKILSHVDGFVKLHKCIETETVALKSAVQRHEGYFNHISQHLKLDLKNS
ncbi:MAG: hypothetical protein A3J66_04060 [Candidatus Magasanikbacteria bacterium RIFCSPHIGHO2_02_FULL_47_14]|uniref:Uncharacterized protein n=1 Tax=Candidatus Magasanikbacteria bacterium RIFCSPHIGHO2_02_FULL_47_14 TaxID=1798680 RepID=A0A1F6M198_9BACT|nr:MAG: hypothetical protein A3J66_04060 [Candidatus Magasanikbacteria bacterium RIFCSPHIGHO2_02_FULL_47_14]